MARAKTKLELTRGKHTLDDDITIMMQEYGKQYDIDGTSTPNDRSNLETMIRNLRYIRDMQDRLGELAADDIAENIAIIDRLQSGLARLIDQNIVIEKTLGIDRKSRKRDDSTSVEGYINDLRKTAREYLDSILIYVYCSDCKVMIGRILPVHDHTEFSCSFQCSQCQKFTVVSRKEKDIFFDLKENSKWRKKYPVEILQPDNKDMPIDDIEDEEIVITEELPD